MKKISFAFIALLVCSVVILSACTGSVSFTTANIKDLKMTTGVDDEMKPVDSVTSYGADAPMFIASCIIANAPEGTKVKFVWKKDSETINESVVETPDSSDRYLAANISNDGPWPAGKYGIEIYIDDKTKPSASAEFTVE